MQGERPVRERIRVHPLSVSGLKITSPGAVRVLPSSSTLTLRTGSQPGREAPRRSSEGVAPPGAGGPRSAAARGARSPASSALQPGVGRFVERPGRRELLRASAGLGSREAQAQARHWRGQSGPQRNPGFGRGIGRLGPTQRAAWPGLAGRGGWNTQNRSCRAVPAPGSQPPALSACRSPK